MTRSQDRAAGAVGLGNSELHSLILSSMTEGVCLVRIPDETIVFTNPAFDAMFGFDCGELIGKPITIIRAPETETAIAAITDEVVQRGRSNYEILNVKKDGSPIWCQGSVTTFEHPELGTVRVMVKEDVTQQREARLALRASQERHRHIVETTREGICVTDAEDRIVHVNHRFEELLGYQPGEMLGMPSTAIVAPWESPSAEERVALRRRGVAGDGELSLVRKDGQPMWFHFGATPRFDEHGVYMGTFRMFTDLTDLKRAHDATNRLREQLVVSDRMASLGTLAAGVGHEINNPLAYMLANLEMIGDELTGDGVARDELARMIANTRDGALRIKRIVGALHTFARPADENRVALDVRAVIDLAIQMVGNQVQHRARLVVDYGAVPEVEADQGRLAQVFINLLVNAAQAIEEGHAEGNEIRVVTRAESERAIVEVRDTGRGFAPETAARIFDPFFTTKPVGEGQGLGLSICHTIVTALGGEITAKSGPGQGTTFRVALPYARRTQVPVAAVAPAPVVAKRRGRVLVVDDDTQLARTLGRVLAAHDTTVAYGGTQALEVLSADRAFDVILCDLMMPEITGMELYARLEAEHPDLARRIIFMTGGAFTPAARAFIDSIPNESVTKPFDLPQLRALVASRVG